MDKLVFSPIVPISVLCVCFVKLEEFYNRYGSIGLDCLVSASQLSEVVHDLVTFDSCIYEFRNSEPFVNLSLQQENLVYRLFLSNLKLKGV